MIILIVIVIFMCLYACACNNGRTGRAIRAIAYICVRIVNILFSCSSYVLPAIFDKHHSLHTSNKYNLNTP